MLILSVRMYAQADFSRNSGHVFQPVPTGFVSQLLPAPPQVLGDYYLSNDWQNGKIYLTDNKIIEGVPLKYNAKENQFEIKTGEIIKVLAGNKVLFFNWYNGSTITEELYINLQEYFSGNTKLEGFARVAHNGDKFKLFCIVEFEESKPNYNIALDVGQLNTIIKKRPTYYLANKQKLIELSRNKKKLRKTIYALTEKDINSFLREEKLNFKSEDDFVELTGELNK